jgi:integrase
VLQPDGTIRRKLLSKKLASGIRESKAIPKAIAKLADETLNLVNSGKLNVSETMSVSDFIEKHYLKGVRESTRKSTQKAYGDIWRIHIQNRLDALEFLRPNRQPITLRDFRTLHGQMLIKDIAAKAKTKHGQPLRQTSLARIKVFLSGAFKEAKRLGFLDAANPMQDTKVPRGADPRETYAYSFLEIKRMLAVLTEPAKTVVLLAACTGLRKGEIRGLRWEDFNGTELSVRQAAWNSIMNEPKTKKSTAPVAVAQVLGDALEAHRQTMGKLAVGPIFQSGNGKKSLNLDNLARRVIIPAIEKCVSCGKPKVAHEFGKSKRKRGRRKSKSPLETHPFELNKSLSWHGWHGFRRGLATNMHGLGVADREIQDTLRHANIKTTQQSYIKPIRASQKNAMVLINSAMETELINTVLTPDASGVVN